MFEVIASGTKLFLLLKDKELINEFFKRNSEFYETSRLLQWQKNILLGEKLVKTQAALWKKHRRVIAAIFNKDYLKNQIPIMARIAREFMEVMVRGELKEVKINEHFERITGEIVGRIFLGDNINQYGQDGELLAMLLGSLITDLTVLGDSITVFPFGGKLYRKTQTMCKMAQRLHRFRSACANIIENRRTLRSEGRHNSRTKDLLDILLDQEELDGLDSLRNVEIIDEFISFFVVVAEATGGLVTTLMHALAKHPEYQTQVRDEIQREYSHTRLEDLTLEILKAMPITNSVLQETLRFWGPKSGTQTREAIKDHEIGNISIKKGTLVGVSMVCQCCNKNYCEGPAEFAPENWRNREWTEPKLSPFLFTPFSARSRSCFEQYLTHMVAKIVASEFLMKFDYKITEDTIRERNPELLLESEAAVTFDLTIR
jgi:cytochrome P450